MYQAVALVSMYCKRNNLKIIYWYKNKEGNIIFKLSLLHPEGNNGDRFYFITDKSGNLKYYGIIFDSKPTIKTLDLSDEQANEIENLIKQYGKIPKEY